MAGRVARIAPFGARSRWEVAGLYREVRRAELSGSGAEYAEQTQCSVSSWQHLGLFLAWNSFLGSNPPLHDSTFSKLGAEKIYSAHSILNPGRPLEYTPSGLFSTPGAIGSRAEASGDRAPCNLVPYFGKQSFRDRRPHCRRLLVRFSLHSVDPLDDDEEDKGDNEKVQAGGDKVSIR